MAESLALTQEERLQIVSMYATSARQIDAVAVAPGWEVIGGFPMRVSADVRLEAFGSVSDPSLTLSVCLYCISVGFEGIVTGSTATLAGNTIDADAFSARCSLVGGLLYQVWAQVTGGLGLGLYGQVRRAAPETAS